MHGIAIPDRPTGLGRSSFLARRATTLADGFIGLPDGITRWRLAAALRTAAPRLNLSSTMLRVAELYIDMTHDADWQNGSEPIVCKPLVEIADRLGLSERQVRNIEHGLVERGLLAWRDSANHHRRGRRDHRTGRLIYAYGPSLAPLGRRAEEILQIAAQCRDEIAELRRHRIAIAALRKRVRTELAAAAGEGRDIEDLRKTYETLPTRNPSGTPARSLAEQRQRLLMLTETLRGRLDVEGITTKVKPSDKTAKTAAKPEISDRHSNKTLTNHSINGETAPRIAGVTPNRRPLPGNTRETGNGQTVAYSLAEAAAHPGIRAFMDEKEDRGWQSLTEACRLYGHLCGIDIASWTTACARLGRQRASLCLIISNADDLAASKPISNRKDYFRAIARKCEERMINLPQSLQRIARKRSMRPWAAQPRHDLSDMAIETHQHLTSPSMTGAMGWA